MKRRAATVGWRASAVVLAIASYIVVSCCVAQSGCPPRRGCRCIPNQCFGEAQLNPCLTGWCLSNTDCFGPDPDGYWNKQIPENPQDCVTVPPLVGSGCTRNPFQSICIVEYFCGCDWDYDCEKEWQRDISYYLACVEED